VSGFVFVVDVPRNRLFGIFQQCVGNHGSGVGGLRRGHTRDQQVEINVGQHFARSDEQ